MSAVHEAIVRDRLAEQRIAQAARRPPRRSPREPSKVWLVFPQSKRVEIYGREGRRAVTSFPVEPTDLFN